MRQVEVVVDVPAKNCHTCGRTVEPSGESPSIHHEVEIAPKPYILTQYNREHLYCPWCRKYGAAPLPSDIGSSAFGTRDIKRFAERAGLDGEWGQVMLEYLKTIFELWRDYREKRRSRRSFGIHKKETQSVAKRVL